MKTTPIITVIFAGQERWRFDFVKQIGAPLPDFGFVCSRSWMATRFTCRPARVS
jgi:hypothetical protein